MAVKTKKAFVYFPKHVVLRLKDCLSLKNAPRNGDVSEETKIVLISRGMAWDFESVRTCKLRESGEYSGDIFQRTFQQTETCKIQRQVRHFKCLLPVTENLPFSQVRTCLHKGRHASDLGTYGDGWCEGSKSLLSGRFCYSWRRSGDSFCIQKTPGLSGRVGMYEMERDINSGWSKEDGRHEFGRRRRGACGGPFFDQCSTKAEQWKRNSKRPAYL